MDVVFYASPDLEFDLVLAPGADPKSVALRYSGFDSIEVEPDGGIALKTPEGVLRQHPPAIVQNGRRIRSRYVRLPSGAIGFEIAEYDREQTLVIDPKISYATYLGGSGNETKPSLGGLWQTGFGWAWSRRHRQAEGNCDWPFRMWCSGNGTDLAAFSKG